MNRNDGLPRSPAPHLALVRIYEKNPEAVEEGIEEALTEAEATGEQYQIRGLLDLQRRLKNGTLIKGIEKAPKKAAKKHAKKKATKKKAAPAAATETP